MTNMTPLRNCHGFVLALFLGLALWHPPLRADETPDVPQHEIRRLKLHPAAEAKPALKYFLLPGGAERQTGNAAVIYASVLERLPALDADQQAELDAVTDTDKPLPKLNREKLERWRYLEPIGPELSRAARQSYCDWQLGDEVMANELLQKILNAEERIGANARILIFEGRFEEALATLQTGMALARDVGQDTVIQGLVAVGVQALMMYRIDEWVQQPGSPNLYWALTTLPRPFIGFHPLAPWEFWPERLVPEPIREKVRTQALSRDEARELLGRFVKYAEEATVIGSDQKTRTHISVDDFKEVPQSVRDRLVGYGYDAQLVRSMPTEQAHLLYTMDRYRELMDEMMKWCDGEFPPHAYQGDVAEYESWKTSENALIAATLAPFHRVHILQDRADRQVARSRLIEAIRMYAADHEGKLPKTLADITAVPIPDDPMTGKPFVYELQGDTAILTPASAPTTDAIDNWRYELTIAR